MIAIQITQPGGPDVLQPVELPVPVPADDEVLIRVAAAGVNRADVMQRQGAYPPPPGASPLPGLEVAGTIEAVGERVTGWRPGDRVCALLTGGGYAEYCAVPAPQCLPVPGAVDIVEAGALPEACFTVWTNVFDRGALAPGEAALFHGGTSGIGTTAIQLGAAHGARVFATAGSDEKARACERLGAERGINYRAEDFVDVVKELTDGRGVDVILDIVGGDYLEKNVRALAIGGRLVHIGMMGGMKGTLDVGRVLTRRLVITGSTRRGRSVVEKGAIAAAVRDHVWPLVERGRFKPIVYRTFPLTEAAQAHRLLESGEHIGKIVLTA
jgi:NADPH2:quinone reductase